MITHTQRLYERHHAERRDHGFSILKEDRGHFFSSTIGTGKKILDIGCRDGALTRFFVESNTVLGVDVDTNSLQRAKELGITTRYMDLYGDWSELHGERFDVIVAGEVLEHLFYPEDILKKVASHLSSGGMFIGSVPNAFSLKNRIRYLMGSKRYTPLSDPTHINQFSLDDITTVLKSSFSHVSVGGLGRYKRLAKRFPNLFAFDLVFCARI